VVPGEPGGQAVKRRAEEDHVIKRLAANAKTLINACDYDAEGETIGDNVLRYAVWGEGRRRACVAKFSTLTRMS